MAYGGNGDRGPFLNTINWVFNAIALAAVLLRFGAHIIREKHIWEPDDFFIILAMVVNLARSICLSIAISRGFGQHLAILIEESPTNTTALLHLVVALQAVGLWTFALPKLPVASLLVRLFGKFNRLAHVVYSLVGLLIIFVTVTTITTFQQCKPVAAQWDTNIHGHCWNRSVNIGLGYFVGSFSASLDFGFALYAVVTVMSLNMTRVQKIVIASSMGLGFGACAVSIYKLTIIKEINDLSDPTCMIHILATMARELAAKFWTGATVPLEVWNSIEGTVLIISAALPLIRPVVWKLLTRLWVMTVKLSSSRSSKNRRQYAITDVTCEDGKAHSKIWTHRPAYVEAQTNDFIPLVELRTNGTKTSAAEQDAV